MYIQKDNFDNFLKDPFNEEQQKKISYSSNLFGFDINKILKVLILIIKYLYAFSNIIIFITVIFLIYFNYMNFLPNGLLVGFIYLVYLQF